MPFCFRNSLNLQRLARSDCMRGDILGEEQLVAVQAVSVIDDFLAQLHLSGRGYVIQAMLLLLLR